MDDRLARVIEKYLEKYCCEEFNVWIDRQIRPTIGANVYRGNERHEVDRNVFIRMIQAILKLLQDNIPDHIPDVYVTYSSGAWKRSGKFHVKAHLTTPAYLDLTAKILQQKPSPFSVNTKELEDRERRDNRASCVRELLASSKRVVVDENSGFSCFQATDLDYPLFGLCKSGETGEIVMSDLPKAVSVLEDYVAAKLKQRGFAISMRFLSSSSSDPVNVAAVFDEKEFARYTGKRESDVRKSWNWSEPKRKYY